MLPHGGIPACLLSKAAPSAPAPKKRACPKFIWPVKPESRSQLAANIAKILVSVKMRRRSGSSVNTGREEQKDKKENDDNTGWENKHFVFEHGEQLSQVK